MNFWTKVIVSSVINALMVGMTSFLLLMEGVESFSEIGAVQITTAVIGMFMAFSKDILAAISDAEPIVKDE